MTAGDLPTTEPGRDAKLAPIHRWILAGWAVVAVGLFVAAVVTVDDSSGWEDLIVFLLVVFLVIALFLVALTWVLIRFLVRGRGARTLVALVGPPLGAALAVLLPNIVG